MAINFKHALIDGVFFTRWSAPPSAEDFQELKRQFAEVDKKVGGKYVYITSIPAHVPVPNAEQRARLNDITIECRKHSPCVYLVLEGNDFQHNLQRAIISGMIILTRTQHDFLLVHKSGETVAGDLTRRLNLNGLALIRKAREADMLA